MRKIISHVKRYIVRGIIALIPLMLSVLAIHFLYTTVDQKITSLFEGYIGFRLPGMGILIVLTAIYLIGLITSNAVGSFYFNVLERISSRIPLVKTTYSVGKQLAATLSQPEKHTFKRAVLVEYLKPGMWTVGFITGSVLDRKNNDEPFYKIFIPTPPNPTSGTIVLVRETQTRDPGWSVREALNAVISAGIIGPEEIRK